MHRNNIQLQERLYTSCCGDEGTDIKSTVLNFTGQA